MNNVVKGMLLMLVILYVLSPVDACPGPVDDLIVLCIWLASQKGSSAIEMLDDDEE